MKKPLSAALYPMLATLALFGTVAAQGCDSSDTSSSEDLTAAGKKLIGARVAMAAVPTGAHFIGLVLSPDPVTANANTFVADIDTGIKCITTPCPSMVHVTGRFTAGTTTITLKADAGQNLGTAASKLMGKFTYVKTSTKLTLTKTGFSQSLKNASSYCNADTADEDCSLQDLDSDCPDTVSWSCSDTNRCVPSCETQAKFCGGFAGIPCPDGLFCKHPDGTCNVADGGGTCAPIAKCNSTFSEPVCGCNGQTFLNSCMATAANAQTDHAGACTF